MADQRQSDNLVARDLMLPNATTINGERTLQEAMDALLELCGDPVIPNALVVVDEDGRYEGVLTARLLFKSLLTLWMPSKSVRDDEERLERQLLAVVRDRGQLHVRDALVRGLPVATPDDRLLRLIDLCCDARLEFVPVVDDRTLVGLVPVTSIFNATAALALTPEHSGIQMDRDDGA